MENKSEGQWGVEMGGGDCSETGVGGEGRTRARNSGEWRRVVEMAVKQDQ